MSKSLYQTNVENRAPLTTDVGVVGNWWIDTSASPVDLYLCTDVTGGVYTWTKQGGSQGSGYFMHICTFRTSDGNNAKISFKDNNSTPYTANTIVSGLYNSGYTAPNNVINASGAWTTGSNPNIIYNAYSDNNHIRFSGIKSDFTVYTITESAFTSTMFIDEVIPC